MKEAIKLKRSLSMFLLTFYGLGTILGAGIYALIGQVARHTGMHLPVAFFIASIIAFFTGITYAELSSRFPKSAGAAFYVRQAFNHTLFSGVVGWLIVLTGLVSAATISHAFVGYLQLLVPIPAWLGTSLLILFFGAIAIWGITESAIISMFITIIEVIGLLLLIYVAGTNITDLGNKWQQVFFPATLLEWSGISTGAFIAFYAFIGFEDMVNLAEETKNPEKTLPYAVLLTIILATLLYLLISTITVLAVPLSNLIKSNAPLAQVMTASGYSPNLIIMIALIAVTNGILVQIIMASRLIYGMAHQQNAPRFFTSIHPKTQTPLPASLLVIIAILILALWFPIETLAKMTSTIMLVIFAIIHFTLIIIKRRPEEQAGSVNFPIFFPIAGMILCVLFLIAQLVH